MKDFLRLCRDTAIVLFVLWHMAAVAVYALPENSPFPHVEATKQRLLPYVRGYMLLTSQWQQWNMFSPDPLRIVTTYDVAAMEDSGIWRNLYDLQPGTFSIWRHAPIFKFIGTVFDNAGDMEMQVIERYLQLACQDSRLEPGTPIRIRSIRYTIPQPWKPASIAHWREWRPEPEVATLRETACLPDPL